MHQSQTTLEFQNLYHAHADAIRRYCFRRLPAQLVEDAVADVFLVVWRRIENAPKGAEATLWLYGIARNVVRNHARSRHRQQRLRARLVGTTTAREVDASVQVVRRFEDQEILNALAQLRPADQEILRLAAWEGLKPAEIGMVLEINPHAASMRLQRARNRLARLIGMSVERPTANAIPRPVADGGER